MRKLQVFDLENLGEAKESRVAPERLLEGDPALKSWTVDADKDGKISAGVFESTPGTNRSIKGETWEYCHILEGVAEITEDGFEPKLFKAGDIFIMKPGYIGTWKTIETVRKIWVVAK